MPPVESLQAVILAGGLGLRLRPAVSDLPKVMAPVSGRPFLEHLLSRLKARGICRFLLCVGYKADDVATYFGDGSRLGVDIAYSVDSTPAGTGGALKLALGRLDDTFLLVNGDTLMSLDPSVLLQYHRARGSLLTLVGRRWRGRPRGDAGYVVAARGGRVLAITRGPPRRETAGGGDLLVNCGWYICEKRGAELVQRPPTSPPGSPFSIESGLYPPLLDSVFVYATDERFVDIGTPERYRRLRQEWESNGLPEPGSAQG
ncbi:MAG: hypothetical protein A2Y96_00905 [Firmicutes bacterium RBG_13_65_8]|nr:MAG: hypothetical protein A2Y96_00905 [Firmicutes bacterium RBG_13_65_8]